MVWNRQTPKFGSQASISPIEPGRMRRKKSVEPGGPGQGVRRRCPHRAVVLLEVDVDGVGGRVERDSVGPPVAVEVGERDGGRIVTAGGPRLFIGKHKILGNVLQECGVEIGRLVEGQRRHQAGFGASGRRGLGHKGDATGATRTFLGGCGTEN